MTSKIAIIGSGFSSLAASCYLAKMGYNVTVFEKNATIGGRARQFHEDGFTFDMGPSWYWMPDVFERFFNDFGKSVSDFYHLDKLSPGYKVFFGKDDAVEISDSIEKIYDTFEHIEAGSAKKLKHFIGKAKDNYRVAIENLVYRPGISPLELITTETATRLGRFFSTISSDVRKTFKNEKLIKILEFPVLFLGAKPSATPGFYSFMNYADFGLGTWQPKGGMFKVIEGMYQLATSLGVTIHTNSPVEKISIKNNTATGLKVNNTFFESDIILSGADYHHTETLLHEDYRQYSEHYWDKKVFAPSSLLFYVGFNKKLAHVNHHNLFFDTDFNMHAKAIYDTPKWPENPLFYANFTSITDPSLAPDGCETGFFLIPLAPNLEDTDTLRERYFNIIVQRFEELTQQNITKNIIFKKSFCVTDFIKDYNSYKGNAYGMANTLLQTAFLRPKLKSKKVSNLYFTGQLTVPGPGVPPALISGKLVAELITKHHHNNKNTSKN